MENAEEVFQILERFSKLKQKDIPKELDEYLCFVAKTGDTVYRWPMIKHLFREKLMQVIKDFYESTPSIADLPQDPNVDPFNYESMKNALLERLELFNAAPFTVQRICELLTDPRKQYSRIDKFMRAIEKTILVVSTIEPGRKRGESETAESVDSVINGDLSSESVDSDENDITFADLTAKLTNDSKVEGNTTEAKENGSTEKPDAEMKEAATDAVGETGEGQPPLPSTENKKQVPAEKPEDPKPVAAKEPEAAAIQSAEKPNDKPTEDMEEDKPIEINDKPNNASAADEAMPIEENKTEETSNIIVPNITITATLEENGVVIAEESKVKENGVVIELKLNEEIISAIPKSPSKPMSEITPKSESNIKKEETEKVDEKREPEDLLEEPEPKKLRTESNYSTVPTVEPTLSTPKHKDEEMTVEPTKGIEKPEENLVKPEESKANPDVVADEPMKSDEVEEKKTEISELVDPPIKESEPKEEHLPDIAQKENGEIKPDSITEVEPSEKKTENEMPKQIEESQVSVEPVVESKSIGNKPSESAVEIPVAEVAVVEEVPIVETSIVSPVATEEPLVVAEVVAAQAVEDIVAPIVETAVVPAVQEPVVVPVAVPVEDAVVAVPVEEAVVVPVEEEKPVVTPIAQEIPASSIAVESIPEASAPLTLIDAPVPLEESINIPAPLSPMQSSETTQEMDTNSNENKMDADDVDGTGSNVTEVATMINKAAADDNAMEVDESVEPMDQ